MSQTQTNTSIDTNVKKQKSTFEDEAEITIAKISKAAHVELEYRFICSTPAIYRQCIQFLKEFTRQEPRQQVDKQLFFVGNVRAQIIQNNNQIGRIETKLTYLKTEVYFPDQDLLFQVAISGERSIDPSSDHYRSIKKAIDYHLAGPTLHTIKPEFIEEFTVGPFASSMIDAKWFHRNCCNIQWRQVSKKQNAFVNNPFSDKESGIFLPFAVISLRCNKSFYTSIVTKPAPEAPIQVRHRSRQTFDYESDNGSQFTIDCTSAVETCAGARPQLSIEIEARQSRGGAEAFRLPLELLELLYDARREARHFEQQQKAKLMNPTHNNKDDEDDKDDEDIDSDLDC